MKGLSKPSAIGLHSIVDGVKAEPTGGKFSRGFMVSAFTKAVSLSNKLPGETALQRTVSAGLLAGAAMHLAGGDFRLGFIAGAMAQFLNAEGMGQKKRSRVRPHKGELVKNPHPDGRFSLEGRFRRNFDGSPRPHRGIDIAGEVGDPIQAAGDGKTFVCPESTCTQSGNQVSITHSDGTVSRYFHLDEVFVDSNVDVFAGQVIGTMGTTGNAINTTQPHLHFEVRVDGLTGSPIDPNIWLGE